MVRFLLIRQVLIKFIYCATYWFDNTLEGIIRLIFMNSVALPSPPLPPSPFLVPSSFYPSCSITEISPGHKINQPKRAVMRI